MLFHYFQTSLLQLYFYLASQLTIDSFLKIVLIYYAVELSFKCPALRKIRKYLTTDKAKLLYNEDDVFEHQHQWYL